MEYRLKISDGFFRLYSVCHRFIKLRGRICPGDEFRKILAAECGQILISDKRLPFPFCVREQRAAFRLRELRVHRGENPLYRQRIAEHDFRIGGAEQLAGKKIVHRVARIYGNRPEHRQRAAPFQTSRRSEIFADVMNRLGFQTAGQVFAAEGILRFVVGVREIGEGIDQKKDVHPRFRKTLRALQKEVRHKHVLFRVVVERGIDEIGFGTIFLNSPTDSGD